METSKKIKVLMARNETTGTQLAEKLGMTQSNFSKKLSKGKFSVADLERIAEILGAKYEGFFILEDGRKI